MIVVCACAYNPNYKYRFVSKYFYIKTLVRASKFDQKIPRRSEDINNVQTEFWRPLTTMERRVTSIWTVKDAVGGGSKKNQPFFTDVNAWPLILRFFGRRFSELSDHYLEVVLCKHMCNSHKNKQEKHTSTVW